MFPSPVPASPSQMLQSLANVRGEFKRLIGVHVMSGRNVGKLFLFKSPTSLFKSPRLEKGVKVPSRRDAKSCQFVFMRKTDLSSGIPHILDRLSKSF